MPASMLGFKHVLTRLPVGKMMVEILAMAIQEMDR
jgi:hypothetical protein